MARRGTKPTKKSVARLPEWLVIPRPPGLWCVPRRSVSAGIDHDAALVDKARGELLKLLSDPYSHEAYQRLRRSRHPSVGDIKGSLPTKLGELAKRYQWPSLTKNPVGRPGVKNPGFDLFLKSIEARQHREKTSQIECCRRYLRGMFPRSKATAIEKKAKELSQALQNHKKKNKR